jgi:hypothetical protein
MRARGTVLQPTRLEALPAIRNHRVGGYVGIRGFGELRCELLGCIGSERLLQPLAMIDNGLGVFMVENGFKFLAWCTRRRRSYFLLFLSRYIFLRRTIFYARKPYCCITVVFR